MKLNTASTILLMIAATIPVLSRKMGVAFKADDDNTLVIEKRSRTYIVPNENRTELCFDPDLFHEQMGVWSSGERLCGLFLLNVWNPGWAKDKGWHFDLFSAVGTLDQSNLEPICDWIQNPLWP